MSPNAYKHITNSTSKIIWLNSNSIFHDKIKHFFYINRKLYFCAVLSENENFCFQFILFSYIHNLHLDEEFVVALFYYSHLLVDTRFRCGWFFFSFYLNAFLSIKYGATVYIVVENSNIVKLSILFFSCRPPVVVNNAIMLFAYYINMI